MTMEDPEGAVERLLARPDLPDGGVSPWRLERYLAEDLPAAERSLVADALRADPALAARLAALRAADEAFEAAHPWSDVGASLFARAEQLAPEAPPRRRGSWRLWLPAAAAAAAVLAIALLPPTAPRPTNRLKGGALFAWQLVEGVPEPREAGATLEAGDRLQFRVTTGHDHLVLLGMDGTGTVSRYVPVGGEVSAPFQPGQAAPLADSLLLDDAPGPEVFVALLSDAPLLVEDLEQALHDAAGEGASRGLLSADLDALAPQVHVYWVEKGPR